MFRLIFALLAVGSVAGLALGFLGSLHPAFDTIAHFRWHFALLLLALVLLGLAMKIRRAPFILLLFALLGVWQSDAGNRIGAAANPAVAEEKTYSLFHFNMRFDNPQMDEAIAMMHAVDADILSLNEVSQAWMPRLAALVEKWPHRFHCPEWNRIGGTMILSKFPLLDENDYCHDYAAIGLTSATIDGRTVDLGTVHLRWPWPASGPRQLQEMAPRLRQIDADALVAGDFNATTWSHALQKFARDGGLEIERGFGGTWIYKWLPTQLAPYFGLPIDNVLSKGRVQITSVTSLAPVGSDHLPMLVKFTLTDQ